MLDLFGGISTGLATMFQASTPVQKYLYVERDENVRKVSSRHLALLMRIVVEVGYSRISVGFAIRHCIIGGVGPCESWSY
jgi:hypothetical protein